VNRYGIAFALIVAAMGYYVGWGDGHGMGAFESKPVERLVYEPYPHQSVCSDMLESAWSIQAAAPPDAGLPHRP